MKSMKNRIHLVTMATESKNGHYYTNATTTLLHLVTIAMESTSTCTC